MCILRVLTHHLSGETKAPPSHIFTHSLQPPNRARKKSIRYYTLHCWCMHSVEFYHLVRNQYYIYIYICTTSGEHWEATVRSRFVRFVVALFLLLTTRRTISIYAKATHPQHILSMVILYMKFTTPPPSTSDNINRTNRGNENVLKDTRCAICVRTLQSASQAKVLSFEKLQKKKPRALRIVKPQSHTHTHIQTYTVISLVAL